MKLDISVILNDDVKYSSDKTLSSVFEIVVFVNLFIKQIDPQNSWRLHKLIITPVGGGEPFKILIRKYKLESSPTEIFLCLKSPTDFNEDMTYSLLDSFYRALIREFTSSELEKEINEDRESFEALCELFFSSIIKSENGSIPIARKVQLNFEGENRLLYVGISHNGLPIYSRLTDEMLFRYEEKNKRDLLESVISGQLSTIFINAFIRAKCYINSIDIQMGMKENHYLFFVFQPYGYNNQYTLEVLTTGQPDYASYILKEISKEIMGHEYFQEKFTGTLSKFKFLEQIIEKYIT